MSVVAQVLEKWLREGAGERERKWKVKLLMACWYAISYTGTTIKGKQLAVEDLLSVYPIAYVIDDIV